MQAECKATNIITIATMSSGEVFQSAIYKMLSIVVNINVAMMIKMYYMCRQYFGWGVNKPWLAWLSLYMNIHTQKALYFLQHYSKHFFFLRSD